MVLRSIAHHPGAIPSEDFQRYFLYLLEQVREGRTRFCSMHRYVPLAAVCLRVPPANAASLFRSFSLASSPSAAHPPI